MTSGTVPGGAGAFFRVALGTSARERWEDHSGRSREPSSAEADERCRVQTFEAEAQRRGVPGDAQEWPHTRHGGVHDHAEKCNDEAREINLWMTQPLHAQSAEG